MLLSRPGFLVLVVVLCAGEAEAQHAASVQVGEAEERASRGREARVRIDARRAAVPVRVDGVLDDPVWAQARPAADFIQAEPREGEPATEPTEVRLAYDEEKLYIAVHAYDSEPDRGVVTDLRRDFSPAEQDGFELLIDTFGDRRNGYMFMITPAGARADQQVANEGREINKSWDGIWRVRTAETSRGWTAEIAIPFRTLRFGDADRGVWGINFARRLRRKNEVSYWAPVPRVYDLTRVSLAGDLAGLPEVGGGRDLRIKPYVSTRTVRETGGGGFDGDLDLGLDVKYGLTDGLTLDLTANPDFAQVEADEQEVNLTQFSQFFPEKRDFFLENSGVFYVGDMEKGARRSNPSATPDQDMLLFHSRRIGLTGAGEPVPLLGGARLTGQAGDFRLGGLIVQEHGSDGDGSHTYGVFRIKRNLFAASEVGGIFMTRQSNDGGEDYNRVYGVDWNIRFPGEVDWNMFLVRTETPGLEGGQDAIRTSVHREGNFFYAKGTFLSVGDQFNNELGYYRRTGMRKYLGETGIRPRPEALRSVGLRELHPHLTWEYYTGHSGETVAKKLHTALGFTLENGGSGEVSVNPEYQLLTAPFVIDPRIDPIPAGGYSWNVWQAMLRSDASRPVSVRLTGRLGGLWSGAQRTLNGTVALKPNRHLRAEVGMNRTAATLEAPDAEFAKTLWTARASWAFNTRTFADALVQYDAAARVFDANIRFNFIHRPLSDLYIVFNEQRIDTPESPAPGRSVILKLTHMVAF